MNAISAAAQETSVGGTAVLAAVMNAGLAAAQETPVREPAVWLLL